MNKYTLKKWIETDFGSMMTSVIEYNGEKRYKSKVTGKLLVSPTRAIRNVFPQPIYFCKTADGSNPAAEWGTAFGKNVERAMNGEPCDIGYDNMEKALENFFAQLEKLGLKPLVCEKHVVDLKNVFHGFVDLVCEDKYGAPALIEIKSRNTKEMAAPKPTDYGQLGIYLLIAEEQLAEMPVGFVALVDRQTGEVEFHYMPWVSQDYWFIANSFWDLTH